MSKSEIWYCRINGETFGPLSLVQILHYIILKRVGEDDEVSNDEENWQPLKQVNMLNPDRVMGLKGILSDTDYTYLENTLAWSQLRHTDESDKEESDGAYGEFKRRRVARSNPAIGYVVMAALVAGVLAISFLAPEGNIEIVPDCTTAPAPEINWSHCRFEGVNLSNSDLQGANLRSVYMMGASLQASNLFNVDLAYANLSQINLRGARLDGADLRGANLRRADLRRSSIVDTDLSYADLTGANLNGANLKGANLSNTIWVDGKICKQGSVGRCIKNF